MRPLILSVASLTIAILAVVPKGPLAFFPPVLTIFLVLSIIVGWWVAFANEIGLKLIQRLDVLFEIAGLFVVFGAYFLLKIIGLHPSGTDDNIYFYLATRVASGAIPYRDFFFSHPPVHLLVPAMVFSITGFSIGIAKAIPAVSQGLAGLFLYLSLRQCSRRLAITTLVLHLTAYEVLMGSTDMNGENLMSAFLFAALLAAVRQRYALSGVLSGLGLGCGLYALAGVLAIAIGCIATGRTAAVNFGKGLFGCFFAMTAVFAILGGEGFYEGVFAYHLSKPIKGSGRVPVLSSANPFTIISALANNLGVWLKEPTFEKFLYYHAPIVIGMLAGVFILLGRALLAWLRQNAQDSVRAILTPKDMLQGTKEGFVKTTVLAFVLFNLQWAAVNEVYDFYLVPMIAFASVPAAFALVTFYERVREARMPRDLFLPALLAAIFCLHVPWAMSLNKSLWPEEQQKYGEVVRYEWREPWALSSLSWLSKALFFEDHRIRGEVTPYYRHYVWNKSLTFSSVEEIADYVQANTTAEETITGASTLAPLVALYADRRIAGDEADTNAKRFHSGVLSNEEFFEKVCSDRVRYIVAAQRSYFTNEFMSANPFASKWFRLEKTFIDTQLVHFRDFPIALYRRVDMADLPDGKVCGDL